MNKLREKLATIEHERWADWQKYLHSLCIKDEDGSLTMPKHMVNHWERQINTPYEELSDNEKREDMKQVDRYWPLIKRCIATFR